MLKYHIAWGLSLYLFYSCCTYCYLQITRAAPPYDQKIGRYYENAEKTPDPDRSNRKTVDNVILSTNEQMSLMITLLCRHGIILRHRRSTITIVFGGQNSSKMGVLF
jgi:hypothetical protein